MTIYYFGWLSQNIYEPVLSGFYYQYVVEGWEGLLYSKLAQKLWTLCLVHKHTQTHNVYAAN